MPTQVFCRLFIIAAVLCAEAPAQAPIRTDTPPATHVVAGTVAAPRLPIREVTVFKDGHALVLSSGDMPVDARGEVLLDELPTPVLGTFWPFAAPGGAKLTSVVAGRRRVAVTRTAIDVRAMIEGNLGAEVWITEKNDKDAARYTATILSVPTRTVEEQDATDPTPGTDHLPVRAPFFLARVAEGTRAVAFDRVLDVTFKSAPKPDATTDEMRNSLRLRLKFEGALPDTAAVGLMYLQRGLRWIPSYKVEIDGKGGARLALQATLVNELADLSGVTLNLVVGVPKFDFGGSLDPMSLQESLARVVQRMDYQTQTQSAYSNAMMSQVAVNLGGGGRRSADVPNEPDDATTSGSRAEDLFVFTIPSVTLRRGERMVLPVVDFALTYDDVYTLDLPQTPPPDVSTRWNTSQQSELARLMAAPKAQHRLRLLNSSKFPLTTAPALILSGGRPLGQGLMTYAAVGARVDLPVTTAVDVATTRPEHEVARTPNAATWNGRSYTKVDLAGTISVTNRAGKPITVEITRTVIGNVDSATNEGRIEQLPWGADADAESSEARPVWWHWYGWGDWWSHFNGSGKVQWTVTVPPGATVSLGYNWHYFWS